MKKTICEIANDQVSTMLATEAHTDNGQSRSKAKLLSAVTSSDFITVNRSSKDLLDREVFRQLKDPDALKHMQLR